MTQWYDLIFAAAVINLRYLLIGASLNPIFQKTSLAGKSLMIHFVADENWAVTMAAHRNGSAAPGFLLGGGIAAMITGLCAYKTGNLFLSMGLGIAIMAIQRNFLT